MLTEEKMSAERIFMLIDNQSVSQQIGIKLIENYGLRQQQKALTELQEKYGEYSAEIETVIKRISENLDLLIQTSTEKIRTCNEL